MATPIQFTNLRGGVNETDPPSALPDDQVVVAENVEFRRSACGEKRRGTTNVTLPSLSATLKRVPFMFRHTPSADETAAELWALFTPADGTQAFSLQRKTSAWSAVTPSDDIDVTGIKPFRLAGASLHGKMFFPYRSVGGVDRLHVWDGTSLRRTGLATPSAAPAVTDIGIGSGSFSGTRYYRTRWAVLSGSTVLRRSEPSATTTFAPNGTGTGARITKPTGTSPAENETHWEVEASINNADFYRIATVIVGTTTYDDSISAYSVGYANSGTLSDDAGDNTVPWSAKFATTDQDRLIVAGAWETSTYASRVGWTPVTLDPGVGNDERIPIDTNNSVDLDGLDGGELTGISAAINGYLFAFKMGRVYKGTRTGGRDKAYDWICITQKRGALPGSVIEGFDAAGNPCVYFTDPKVGPCRIGVGGLLTCGQDVLKTWRTVNRSASIPVHGIYYPDAHQLHYWLATNSADQPNKKIVLHTNQSRDFADGVRKGWVTWSEGDSVGAVSSCLFADNIDANTTRSLNLVPFVGVTETAGGDRNLIQRCDTGSSDRGSTYTAYVRTRPVVSGGLLTKFGAVVGAILATAASGVSVALKVIRDFGLSSKTSSDISLTPVGTEDQVIRIVDNLTQSEMLTMQVEFGDLNADSGLWEVNSIVIGERPEDVFVGGDS